MKTQEASIQQVFEDIQDKIKKKKDFLEKIEQYIHRIELIELDILLVVNVRLTKSYLEQILAKGLASSQTKWEAAQEQLNQIH